MCMYLSIYHAHAYVHVHAHVCTWLVTRQLEHVTCLLPGGWPLGYRPLSAPSPQAVANFESLNFVNSFSSQAGKPMVRCCLGGSSEDSDDGPEEPTGGGRRPSQVTRGLVRTFESGSGILQKGRRRSDSELDLLKSSSAVTSTLRGLLKDSMGQVTDAAPRAHALP